MRKLFLLIPALILSMVMNATTQTISPSSGESDSNIRSALSGSADTIILNAGNYKEADQIHFRRNAVIMAAEGAEVIITPKYYCDFVYENTKIKIIGIKFDGSVSGQQAIRVYDNKAGKELRLENCEFYNFSKAVISGDNSTYPLDSCIINNCYFHNNKKSSIYFAKSTVDGVQTCHGLIVKNSTFANIDVNESAEHYASVIDVNTYDYSNVVASDVEVLVDHCTFYNYLTYNTDHCAVRVRRATNTTVSNCIFAHPSEQERRSTYCYNGLITNCLSYNLTKSTSSYTHASTSDNTITNCVIAEPRFTDAENGDFSFANNWVTMNISPACGAATDGTDLGDPRWYTTPIVPSSDFAAPGYKFLGTKAQLSGSFALNGDSYIQSQDKTYAGIATWKIQAERKCVVEVTLNIAAANTSGHRYEVALYNANNEVVGTTLAESEDSWSAGDKVFGTFEIPAAGIYTVRVTNDCNYSATILEGVTFTYIGGAVQNMPGTTDIADAWFSANGTRANGKISYSSISSGCWAKWNINVAAAGTYNVTVNISGQYGHDYTVEFLKEGETTPIVVTKGATNYTNDATLYANELGSVVLEAANYEIKVFNNVGDAALHSVKLEYAGGGVQNMPGTTDLMEAWFSSNGTRNNGAIEYTSVDNGCWAKWNVAFAKGGNYNVIVNIRGQYGHDYTVEFLKEGETTPIVVTKGAVNYTNDATLYANELGSVALEAGNYEMKVSNAVGDAALISVTLEYLGGARATLPATFDFDDAILSSEAHVTGGNLWFSEIGDSNPVGEWAKWNVKAASAGVFLFTMNVSSTNGQSYKISILDGETVVDAFESGSVGENDQTIKHYFDLAAGNYTVMLENKTSWSQGHIVSLAVTQPEILTIDETAETNAVIYNNYRNGNHGIQIIRTIVPGMYNTICLPFDVSSAQLKAIFGSDVELLQMASATLSGEMLNLNFDAATSIYRGTPYLIRTSKAVVNPVFSDVEIKAEAGAATGGDDVDFIGSFIKKTIDGDPNNLYLEANNTLNFSDNAVTMKGMRAYFHVKGAAAAAKRARIVTRENIVTEIDLVNDDNKAIKRIENGQVIILRDGVRYNTMGTRLQ